MRSLIHVDRYFEYRDEENPHTIMSFPFLNCKIFKMLYSVQYMDSKYCSIERICVDLKGKCHEICDLWFFHLKVHPGPLIYNLVQFCSQIIGNIWIWLSAAFWSGEIWSPLYLAARIRIAPLQNPPGVFPWIYFGFSSAVVAAEGNDSPLHQKDYAYANLTPRCILQQQNTVWFLVKYEVRSNPNQTVLTTPASFMWEVAW